MYLGKASVVRVKLAKAKKLWTPHKEPGGHLINFTKKGFSRNLSSFLLEDVKSCYVVEMVLSSKAV